MSELRPSHEDRIPPLTGSLHLNALATLHELLQPRA